MHKKCGGEACEKSLFWYNQKAVVMIVCIFNSNLRSFRDQGSQAITISFIFVCIIECGVKHNATIQMSWKTFGVSCSVTLGNVCALYLQVLCCGKPNWC